MTTPSSPNGKSSRPTPDEFAVARDRRLELADQIVRDLASGRTVSDRRWNDWKRQDNICAYFLSGVEQQWEVGGDE